MLHAHDVLSDCELALVDFQAAVPTTHWRIRWTALVALLRSVGYVLKAIDRAQSSALTHAVDEAWTKLKKTKPEPCIFWKFIDQERNNVIHAYRFGVRLNTTITPGTGHLSFSGQADAHPSGSTTYESFMRSGVYQGRNALDVCREAIGFWQRYLDDVEAAARGNPPSTPA